MAAESRKSARSVHVRSRCKGNGAGIPRKVFKFTKQGRNRGQVLASEKRDRTTYDYSDEM